MTRYGAVDWDETSTYFQYKLGYCSCGKKILARPDELEEIVNAFAYMIHGENVIKRLAVYLLKKLA